MLSGLVSAALRRSGRVSGVRPLGRYFLYSSAATKEMCLECPVVHAFKVSHYKGDYMLNFVTMYNLCLYRWCSVCEFQCIYFYTDDVLCV